MNQPPYTPPESFQGPIAVFGCGLIGASLAAAWSAAGHTVWGCDRRDLTLLLDKGWIRRQVPPEDLPQAKVVVLALPPQGIVAALRRIPFRPGQLVTDTGSVKAPVEQAAKVLPDGVRFIGGHPLAGDTASGFEAARTDLFQGASWVLLPSPAGPARGFLEDRIRELGAEPLTCSARRHDRIVALTSHLPQLLSTALAAEIAALDDPLADRLLGGGGQQFLRLAASPYPLWRDILSLNHEAVTTSLNDLFARASQPVEAQQADFRAANQLLARLGASSRRS
jgi:prephenate dehydrogenase